MLKGIKKIESKIIRPTNEVAPKRLELLVTVVDKKKADFYIDLLTGFRVNMQLCVAGTGTATSETLSMLGLDGDDKAVIFSVIRDNRVKEALSLLEEKFRTVKNGKGIAYAIPLSSVIGVASFKFLADRRDV